MNSHMKHRITLFLIILVIFQACNKEDPDDDDTPCPDYTLDHIYKQPTDSIDLDGNDTVDFIVWQKWEGVHPISGQDGNYDIGVIFLSVTNSKYHSLVVERESGDYKDWFLAGDTIHGDSVELEPNTLNTKYYIEIIDFQLLITYACNSKYNGIWRHSLQRETENDMMFMTLFNPKTQQLGWLQLKVNITQGEITYIDHYYGNKDFVVIGQK